MNKTNEKYIKSNDEIVRFSNDKFENTVFNTDNKSVIFSECEFSGNIKIVSNSDVEIINCKSDLQTEIDVVANDIVVEDFTVDALENSRFKLIEGKKDFYYSLLSLSARNAAVTNIVGNLLVNGKNVDHLILDEVDNVKEISNHKVKA